MTFQNYKIRKSKIEDMVDVMKAHKLSIQQICSKDYKAEQIAHWSNFQYSPEIFANAVNNEFHYVIEVDGKVEGFCHAAAYEKGEGEIKGLYFSPKATGRGTAKEIFDIALNYLKEHKCTHISISSSKTAKGFYEKMGFTTLGKNTINIRGQEIECYQMERFLV